MNIDHSLTINATAADLTANAVRLDIRTPGRAIITTRTDTTPARGHSLMLNSRLNGGDWRPVIWGFIETVQQLNTGHWQLVAREAAAALNRPLPLNLRHCQPADVLAAISDHTGLVFVLPASDWTKTQIGRFQHTGGGYGALDAILRIWNVTGGIWQQQPDGRVFIGERTASATGGKTISLPATAFSDLTAYGGTLPLLPRLRPGTGVQIDDGTPQIVHTIDINGDTMRLQWRPTLNSNNLRATP